MGPGILVSGISCPWKGSPHRESLDDKTKEPWVVGRLEGSPQNRGAPLLCSLTEQELQGWRKMGFTKGSVMRLYKEGEDGGSSRVVCCSLVQ